MSAPCIPEEYRDLLAPPPHGHLGTIRPDDTVRVTPMGFEFGCKVIRFSQTTKRQKCRKLKLNPSMALSIIDPDAPHRYIELAGHLREAIRDL